jgi:hypothetical protein
MERAACPLAPIHEDVARDGLDDALFGGELPRRTPALTAAKKIRFFSAVESRVMLALEWKGQHKATTAELQEPRMGSGGVSPRHYDRRPLGDLPGDERRATKDRGARAPSTPGRGHVHVGGLG